MDLHIQRLILLYTQIASFPLDLSSQLGIKINLLSQYLLFSVRRIQSQHQHHNEQTNYSLGGLCFNSLIPRLPHLPNILETKVCSGTILGGNYKPSKDSVGENGKVT